MKKIILGTFKSRPRAEILIQHLQGELNLSKDDISCICRTTDGQVYEIEETLPVEDPSLSREERYGAMLGGFMGSIAGLATLVSIIPAIGPVFARGPIIMAVGIGISALGMVVAGTLSGAVIGGIVGTFFNSTPKGLVRSEDDNGVLVVAHTRDEEEVGRAFTLYGASGVEVYTPTFA